MLHQFQKMILIGLFTHQTLLYQGIDSAKEKWRSKRSIKGTNQVKLFPPSKSDDYFLRSSSLASESFCGNFADV